MLLHQITRLRLLVTGPVKLTLTPRILTRGYLQKGPRAIALALASKKVSPRGPGSGMRMLNFYINRAGNNLNDERITALQKAKKMLSGIIAKQKNEAGSTKSSTGKQSAKQAQKEKSM
jgi:hypothetical protein